MSAIISKDLKDMIRPDLDYRKYRFIQLPNGLRALLISDLKDNETPMNLLNKVEDETLSTSGDASGDDSENEDESNADSDNDEEKEDSEEKQKAAAALSVGVGSFSDPWESQGLAHYLEHMVFMGSEKFPSENDFDAYISQRGGTSNAFTAAKSTVFYFNVRPNHFYGSLDRFANFFIAPLLKKDAMDRELTAVHSEYEMARQNDGFREVGLGQCMAKEGSPYRIFSSGSKKSLREIPSEKGFDVYKYLQELRLKMYSAHFMTLSVIAKDSLDNLEKMVTTIFSDIPTSKELRPNFSAHALPFETEAFTKLYKINPINDSHVLEISWSLPSHYPEYKSHPLQIFGYIIGHEAKGSIISFLRKKNLAVDISAGCSLKDCQTANEMTELMSIEITLTDKGLQNYEEVIEIVFEYLNMLRVNGISQELFAEYQTLLKMNFRYSSLKSPLKSVLEICQSLQYIDDYNWLLCRYCIQENHDSMEFHKILSFMTAEKACYLLKSKKFATECSLEEPWYGCKYTVCDIEPGKFAKWNSAKPSDSLFLPEKNTFIPNDFTVLPLNDAPVDKPVDLTSTLDKYSKYGCLYYKMDKNFRVPKACVKVILWSQLAWQNEKNMVLHSLFTYAVNQNLLDIAYYATEASLSYQISGVRSVSIHCYGFNDTLFNLYRTIIDYLKNFEITESQFQAYVDIHRQKYLTDWYKPQKFAQGLCSFVLKTGSVLPHDQLTALRNLTVDDVRNYHKEFLSAIRLSVYVHGNLTADDARHYFKFTVDSLENFNVLPEIVHPQVRQKPIGDDRIRVYNLNPQDINTAIFNVFQFGPVNIHQSCVLEILGAILDEPAFNYLRTIETLGYSVGLYVDISFGIAALVVLVASQSDKFSLDHCHSKMNEFLYKIAPEKLQELSKEDFQDFIKSSISQRKMDDTQMLQEVGRNVDELIKEEYVFDRREREISSFKQLTKAEVISMFNAIVGDESKRRILSIQVEAKNVPIKCTDEQVDEWKLTLESAKPDIVGSGNWLDHPRSAHEWELYPHNKVLQ